MSEKSRIAGRRLEFLQVPEGDSAREIRSTNVALALAAAGYLVIEALHHTADWGKPGLFFCLESDYQAWRTANVLEELNEREEAKQK